MLFDFAPTNKQAVDAAVRHFRRQRGPAVIVLPTGAGKSLVIAELARIAKGRVLVLAHVKELVEQNHGKYESYGLEGRHLLGRPGAQGPGRQGHLRQHPVGGPRGRRLFRATSRCSSSTNATAFRSRRRRSTRRSSAACSARTRSSACSGLTATPYRLGLGWIYQLQPPRRAAHRRKSASSSSASMSCRSAR